ncbi:hypothetical protein [Lentzea waywayandensis]|nr:hypothetical protein [Lentzea waywayandensis]
MRKPFAIAAALAATLLTVGLSSGTAHAETVPAVPLPSRSAPPAT